MPRHRQVDVVVIECMGNRTVDQRRRQHRQACIVADDAGLRRAASFACLFKQDADKLVVGAGEPDPEIVKQALPRQLAHPIGEHVIGYGDGPFGERPGQVRSARYR
jgi:hypothetical protein